VIAERKQMSPWFREYCAQPSHQAIGTDGWPVAVPLRVADALRTVLADYSPQDELIEQAAARIYSASAQGRNEERPVNLAASASKTEKELRALHDLAEKLADLIDGMHGPASAALAREGLIICDLVQPLRYAAEIAVHAFGDLDGLPERNPGAKPLVEARAVTQETALFFSQITGREPTRIVDTGLEYGEWLDTLRVVFAALGINASPEKQAQAFRTRTAAERE
jgi:hypothetical protein